MQVPGYLESQDALRARGIDEVLIYCVNDGAVMDAWATDQKIEGSMITFLGDPSRAFTDAVDMVLDHPGPMSVLGYKVRGVDVDGATQPSSRNANYHLCVTPSPPSPPPPPTPILPSLQRSKRFALYVEDGTVKAVRVSEGPDDPAGDSDPSLTTAEAMIQVLDELHPPVGADL